MYYAFYSWQFHAMYFYSPFSSGLCLVLDFLPFYKKWSLSQDTTSVWFLEIGRRGSLGDPLVLCPVVVPSCPAGQVYGNIIYKSSGEDTHEWCAIKWGLRSTDVMIYLPDKFLWQGVALLSSQLDTSCHCRSHCRQYVDVFFFPPLPWVGGPGLSVHGCPLVPGLISSLKLGYCLLVCSLILIPKGVWATSASTPASNSLASTAAG